jgi:hypothetical protein
VEGLPMGLYDRDYMQQHNPHPNKHQTPLLNKLPPILAVTALVLLIILALLFIFN